MDEFRWRKPICDASDSRGTMAPCAIRWHTGIQAYGRVSALGCFLLSFPCTMIRLYHTREAGCPCTPSNAPSHRVIWMSSYSGVQSRGRDKTRRLHSREAQTRTVNLRGHRTIWGSQGVRVDGWIHRQHKATGVAQRGTRVIRPVDPAKPRGYADKGCSRCVYEDCEHYLNVFYRS